MQQNSVDLVMVLKARNEASAEFNKFRQDVDFQSGLISRAFKAVSVAAVTAFAVDALRGFMVAGEEMERLSARTGLAVEDLNRLNNVAGFVGTTTDSMARSINEMQRRMGEGGTATQDFQKAIAELGLAWGDFQSLRPEQQLFAVNAALGNVGDNSRRVALANKLMGESWREVAILQRQTEDSLARYMELAERFGPQMDEEIVAKAAKARDMWTVATLMFRNLQQQVSLAVVDPMGYRGLGPLAEPHGAVRASRSIAPFGVSDMLGGGGGRSITINADIIFADNDASVRRLAEAVADADIDRGR